jgi:hypothetical protein
MEAEYVIPTVPPGKLAVVTAGAGTEIVMLRLRVALAPAESAARTVNA